MTAARTYRNRHIWANGQGRVVRFKRFDPPFITVGALKAAWREGGQEWRICAFICVSTPHYFGLPFFRFVFHWTHDFLSAGSWALWCKLYIVQNSSAIEHSLGVWWCTTAVVMCSSWCSTQLVAVSQIDVIIQGEPMASYVESRGSKG